jgi:hypothetical protein
LYPYARRMEVLVRIPTLQTAGRQWFVLYDSKMMVGR